MYEDHAQEFPGALANHFAQADDYTQAVVYYEQAAHKALQLSAPQEAVAHLIKSLELLSRLPPSSDHDHQELGLLFTLAGPLIATNSLLVTRMETSVPKAFASATATDASATLRSSAAAVALSPYRPAR
jgi:hypothetical protein